MYCTFLNVEGLLTAPLLYTLPLVIYGTRFTCFELVGCRLVPIRLTLNIMTISFNWAREDYPLLIQSAARRMRDLPLAV